MPSRIDGLAATCRCRADSTSMYSSMSIRSADKMLAFIIRSGKGW